MPLSSWNMDRNVANSIEAISNLIYLVRHSLRDPTKALSYVELAEEELKTIALDASRTALWVRKDRRRLTFRSVSSVRFVRRSRRSDAR
jgi:hypothetical protein